MSMNKIEQNVLLLDIGGTLVDITEPYEVYTERAAANMVAQVKPEMDAEEAKQIALDTRRKIRAEAHSTFTEFDFLDFTTNVMAKWEIEKWNDQNSIEAAYVEAELEITKNFDDTIDFLTRARAAGKRIVALTNNFSALHVQTLLDRFGLRPFFDDIFISASLRLRKPSAELMDQVLASIDVDRQDVIIVGDKVSMDVELGLRSGVATCLVARNTRPEGHEKADILVDTRAEIEF